MNLFTHDNQPYGSVTFTIDSVTPVRDLIEGLERGAYGENQWLFNRAAKGWVELTGTVVQGSHTNRLFHATSTTDLAGKPYRVQVPAEAYEKGHYVSVAM